MPSPTPGADPADLLAELEAQLEQYDASRYPVQHATARFHLGSTLIGTGAIDEAVANLHRAVDLFPADGLPVEHAKATNMLGVALRERGSLAESAAAFSRAEALFDDHAQPLELAASRFNRGLVLWALGELEEARDAFDRALAVFREADAREQAAAAARELGSVLLELDRLDEAATVLRESMDLARRGAGRQALGTASNVLGLVLLRANRPQQARGAFEDAAGAHPRGVRPQAHAMARANLALACEGTGDHDHARLAARQALATPGAPPEVRDQADGILARLGDDPMALVRVLDHEPQERWVPVIREEVRRLVEAADDVRRREVDAWVDGLVDDRERSVERCEAWLDVLLELPPTALETMVAATVHSINTRGGDVAEDLRSDVSRAMIRFQVPQWMRLKELTNRISTEQGHEVTWS